MGIRLPSLPALRLFEAAGRHLSFKRAAAELGVTPSAVSHGVLGLEKWLGIQLFRREPRGLTLTTEGAEYLQFVSEAFITIATGTDKIPGKRSGRSIVVSCPPTFASRCLVPAVSNFLKLEPKVSLAINTSQSYVAFPHDGVDIAIRMARRPPPGLRSSKLLVERLVPVCSPRYLAKISDKDGVDFSRAEAIHVTTLRDDWEAWEQAAGTGALNFRGELSFDSIQLAWQAARQGLGVAIGRLPMVRAELADGTLVPAKAAVVESQTAYWVVRSSEVRGRNHVVAFEEWLLGQFTASLSCAA
jgi:LysR family transcriptional regulator, glycine cleavage system transcriptional activator